MRQNGLASPGIAARSKLSWIELVFDDSRLVIGTDKPDKDPKIFELKHIVLQRRGLEICVAL